MWELLVNASTKAMKYILFLSNFVFVLTGISLVAVGIVIKSSNEHFEPIFKDLSNYTTAPHLLIFIGLMVFCVAFFGCCGALKENHCMIVTFSVFMVAIFVAEAIIGITGYTMKSDADDILFDTLNTTMYQYNKSSEDTSLWDQMQGQLNCCGTKNYTDWQNIFHTSDLPMTCCSTQLGEIGKIFCNTSSADLHKTPCMSVLSNLIQSNASTIGLTGIIIAVIQLLGVIFACTLAKTFRGSYESV